MIIMDIEKLHSDIWSSLHSDPIASTQLNSPSSCWSVNSKEFLIFDEKIYIPNYSDLWLCILQYKHDHPISRYFRQNWTMELVQWQYIWLKLHDSIKSYVKSCTTCMHSKSQRHCPYRLLKQLPIPKRPWDLRFMDFIEKFTHVQHLWHDIGHHWLPHQAVNLYPNCQYHHIPNVSQTVCPLCLL